MSADSKVVAWAVVDRYGQLCRGGDQKLIVAETAKYLEPITLRRDREYELGAPHDAIPLVAHNPEREAVIKELIRVVETDVAMRQSSAGYAAWQLWNSCTAVADALARYKETTS